MESIYYHTHRVHAEGVTHIAMKGDSCELVPMLASAEYIITGAVFDPPYTSRSLRGGGRRRFDDFETLTPGEAEPIVEAIAKMLLNDRDPLIFIFSTSPGSAKVAAGYKAMIERYLKPALRGHWQKVYKDGRPVKFRGRLLPREEIIIYTRSGETFEPAQRLLGDDFELRMPRGKWLHTYATEKPVWLIERLLERACVPESDWKRYYYRILDPFAGSGSTQKACANLGMNSTNIDVKHLIDLSNEK